MTIAALILLAGGDITARPSMKDKTTYYYNLKNLTHASAPRRVKMVNIDHLSTGKKTIERGLLFTCRNRNARQVSIAGSFTAWKPQAMRRSSYGIWYYFAPSPDRASEMTYKYIVDGTWITDPSNPFRRDDNAGSYVSLAEFPGGIKNQKVTFKILADGRVEFRLYRPEARMIAIAGDFNNWNPENDILRRGKRGIWHLTKELPPGKYRYQYIVDGEWTFDLHNKNSGSSDTGELCSVVTVPR